MALNTLVEGFFPHNADAAVLVLNALLGVGTAFAPVLVALFTGLGMWWGLPLLVVLLLAVLLSSTLRAALQLPYNPASAAGAVWFYAAAAVLYGVAETLCGNWSTLYLTTERGVPAGHAALALTAFWVSVTLGRLFVVAPERVVAARWIYLALPVLLAVAFQAIAHAENAVVGIGAFAAAGFACSALLPLSISFAGEEFSSMAAVVSGGLIAFYQAGYGLAAFSVGPLHQLDERFLGSNHMRPSK